MADKVKCQYCSELVDKTAGQFCKKPTGSGYAHVECVEKHNRALELKNRPKAVWDIVGPLPSERSMPTYQYKYTKPYQNSPISDPAREPIHQELKEHLGELYSKKLIDKELDRMIQDGKTYLGIAKAINYWIYEKKQDFFKSRGKLSIIDYIYTDALEFYDRLEKNASRNQDKTIKDSIGEAKQVVVHTEPMRKPLRVKLFDLE